MTRRRYQNKHKDNFSRDEGAIPSHRNGANIHVVTCLCGMTQRIILTRLSVRECVNRLAKCHYSFYIKDGQVCIGGLKS